MAKATSGSDAQFTYDFGIAISQSTINKVTRLIGVTLSLASAYYALKTTSEEYINTLRENTFRFGGMLGTMQAMEQAQNRLIKGLTYFNVDDQLRGMNQLMAVGVDMRKNLDWITKAAHASGQSLAQFSGAIANAISGNMGQLVDMGLITQRATRMFDKYAANTVMRQQAILNFVKNHKGLLAAIRNDFYTIQDQMNRIKETWSAFLQSILGKPNDPSSFYGQIARSMKLVADALANNLEQIRRVGFVIGSVLGWVMKQIGHFVVWIGKQVKQSLGAVWKMTDNYKEFTRSLLVWLEFWKLKVVDFFKEYGGAIKTVLKLVIAYKALKLAFVIGEAAILSVIRYKKALHGLVLFMKGPWLSKTANALSLNLLKKSNNRQILRFFGIDPRKIPAAFQSVAEALAKLPSTLMKVPSKIKTAFAGMFRFALNGLKGIGNFLLNLPSLSKIAFSKMAYFVLHPISTIVKGFRIAVTAVRGLFMALNTSNPVGWVIIAITAIIILYNKCRVFRAYVNELFKSWIEYGKLLWNIFYGAFIAIAVGCKKSWKFLKGLFESVKGWIKNVWDSFKDSSVGRFIDKYIVSPLRSLFNWIMKALRWLLKGAAAILSVINTKLAEQIRKGEQELGFEKSYALQGSYDNNRAFQDDTNYMSEGLRRLGVGGDTESNSSVNPITAVNAGMPGSSGGTSVHNSMDFNNGAIQIIVNRGDQIDENRLARLVRNTLADITREQSIRGGRV